MSLFNDYKIVLTTKSPVHIGTGEAYEPTSFIIDENRLYEFDEFLLVKSFSELQRNAFVSKFGNYIEIINFYKKEDVQKLAKQIFEAKIPVSDKVQNKFNTIRNQDGTRNKNLFEVHKTFKNPNTHIPVIPGSSIKGMLDTIFGIYPRKKDDEFSRQRQELIISDAFMIEGNTKIGYSYRRHKNPNKQARSDIPQIIEVIDVESTFLVSIRTKLDFEEIVQKVRKYYGFESRRSKNYKDIENGFMARVGKFSGKAFMVADGRDVKNNDAKPVATHTLFEDGSEFGWVEFLRIDEQKYTELLQKSLEVKERILQEKEHRQKEIRKIIEEKEQARKEEARLKVQQEQEEKEKQEAKQKAEAEKLAQMSPLDKLIYELDKQKANPNETIDIVIYNAIKEGKLDEFRCEALKRLKQEMQNLKKWAETSKKPQKDKKYKRTMEVIKMMEGCTFD